ncbi:MAG: Lsr2 family protein [Propionibacteriaceae bacterium]|jgi:hypothetical protein|nr:Lsr2 family protein [Propionibacteriaceae bacterium]
MAKRTEVVLIDDLDGSIADSTVAFALDGVSYEIDLSKSHADAFRASLDKWLNKARRVGGRRRSGRPTAGGAEDIAAIRAWAKANGYQVNDRGRISAKIREAYAAAK